MSQPMLGFFTALRGEKPDLSASALCLLTILATLLCTALTAHGQSGQIVDLTLDSAVELSLKESYRVQQLRLDVKKSRKWLEARRAGLRSRAYANVKAPDFQVGSNRVWNSNLGQYDIVPTRSRMWRANVAVRQPIVLFGRPTNGYLSLNSQVYRYVQGGGEESTVRYYNRYFIKLEQPLFQPNTLDNNIRRAELDLKQEGLDVERELVDIITDAANKYYRLFELAYERRVYSNLVNSLKRAKAASQSVADKDTSRSIEISQLQVELGNARQQLSQAKSSYRLWASQVKQHLRLRDEDSLRLNLAATIPPIQIDEEQAAKHASTLRPMLQTLDVRKRKQEISLENERGNSSFHLDLVATYGREMQNPHLPELFDQPTNSYSVGLSAHIPIWDWGRHDARVEARALAVRQTDLLIEERKKNLQLGVENVIQNLEESQERATDLRENLKVAKAVVTQNLQRYRNGQIAAIDLITSIEGQKETAINFLNAYLSYRNALLALQKSTYYDFEKDKPLLSRFATQDVFRLVRDTLE